MSLRSDLYKLLRSEVYPRLEKLAESAKEHPLFQEDFWQEVKASYQGEDPVLKEHYATLELRYGSSLEQVKVAYKTLMKQHHPDRFQNEEQKQVATEHVKKLNEAYTALKHHLQER